MLFNSTIIFRFRTDFKLAFSDPLFQTIWVDMLDNVVAIGGDAVRYLNIKMVLMNVWNLRSTNVDKLLGKKRT